jgi:O-antigen/teichoic acid export membrane protein
MSTGFLILVYLALSASEMNGLKIPFLPAGVSELLLPTMGLVFTLSIDKILQSIAFRMRALRVLAATRIIRAVALVGIQVSLVYAIGANARVLLGGQLVTNALMSILLAAQLGLLPWLVNADEWQRLPRRLVPLIWKFRAFPFINTPHAFVHGFLSAAYGMLIGLLYGSVAAGEFYMMLRILFGVTDLIATALNQQGIAEAATREHGRLQAVSKYVIVTLLIVTVPISVCAFLFGKQLFALVLGESWAQAGQFAAASAARIVMEPLAAALSFLPNFLHRQGQAFAWSIIQNLAGLLLLVTAHRQGFDVGAAIAISATGMSVVMLACVIWLWRISGLSAIANR